MKYKELLKFADEGSVKAVVSLESGIVAVTFKVQGVKLQCQYSCTSLYAISFIDGLDAVNAFQIMAGIKALAEDCDAAAD